MGNEKSLIILDVPRYIYVLGIHNNKLSTEKQKRLFQHSLYLNFLLETKYQLEIVQGIYRTPNMMLLIV